MARFRKIGYTLKNEYLINIDNINYVEEKDAISNHTDVIVHFNNGEILFMPEIGLPCFIHQLKKEAVE